MEKKLSYVLMLSLKEMALRRIAVILVNQPDFLAMTEKFPFESVEWYQSQWLDTAEWKIADSASKLGLPELLTGQMIPVLKAVSTEILRWKSYHKEFLDDPDKDFGVDVVDKLCWSTAGTVDCRKTAEALVRSDVLDVATRFKLSCLYCLEDDIPVVWKELPDGNKKDFHGEAGTSQMKTPPLQLVLPSILRRFCFPGAGIHGLFKHAAILGLRTLAESCFSKLSKEERAATLVRTATDVVMYRDTRLVGFRPTQERFSDVACCFLSLMTPEQQMGIFREQPCQVLRCFLDWPWQDLFLDIADVVWTFLPESKYAELLNKIANHIGNSGYYLPNFFREFFLRSPRSFRKCFVDRECSYGFYLREFFAAEDSRTVEVVFGNIDATDRERLVCSEHALKLLDDFLLKERWRMVQVCIRAATLSEEGRQRLKRSFAVFAARYDGGVRFGWRKQRRKRFFEFLDETDAIRADKRNPEDETVSEVKKSRV